MRAILETLEARPQQQLLFVRVDGWTINSAAPGMMLLENGEIHKGPQTYTDEMVRTRPELRTPRPSG